MAQQGLVYTTEGNVIHYGYIEEFIEELGTKYNIREIAFGRWGAVQMTQNLEGLGFMVVPFGQGYKDMSPPTKELMKLTLECKLAHGGHPVLRWIVRSGMRATAHPSMMREGCCLYDSMNHSMEKPFLRMLIQLRFSYRNRTT